MSEKELKRNEAGVCPVCGGSELTYGDSGLQDEGYFYSWECGKCGACGKEWYDLVFSGHVLREGARP